MIISDSLTIGQVTFILRVAIQILGYGGLALTGLIILGNAPRVAPIDTHDVVNRIVGASSATTSSAKWIFSQLRGKSDNPTASTNLIIALTLSISYTAVVSLSDVGFLGFYACSVPGPSLMDSPASISSTSTARLLVTSNMVNGTDPSVVKAYRCDAIEVLNFGDVTENSCTAWRNSTYADMEFFKGINSTDSDVLMPRQLMHHKHPKSDVIDLNSYYIGPNTQRVTSPILHKGIAVEPHESGVRVVFGVPQLEPEHRVILEKTMAVEVDVGCMALGIYAQHQVDAAGQGIDLFATTGNWRKYTGPDYLRDVLSNTTDILREYYRPLFNTSSMSADGFMYGINDTRAILSSAANVAQYRLPTPGFETGPDNFILGNCTADLQTRLGISIADKSLKSQARMCGLLGIGGSIAIDGALLKGFSRMVCASATQVNMVNATIEVNREQKMTMSLIRLPSDLNYLRADYWDTSPMGNDTMFIDFVPYERFTLNDNAHSPTSHFVAHSKAFLVDNTLGPGSGGNAIARVGDMVLASDGSLSLGVSYAGLTLLDEGFDQINLTTSSVTRWMGEVGGSFILTSVGYNGWAAKESPKIQVLSTGGHAGSCYKPQYALGFFPILFAATVILCWTVIMLCNSSLFGSKAVREGYGGIAPYANMVCPGAPSKTTLLVWEKMPQPHLEVVGKGGTVTGDASGAAVLYLKSRHSYP